MISLRGKKALIGSCGGLTGVYLAKRLSRYAGLSILGSDVSSTNVGSLFVSEVVGLPPALDESFVPELGAVLNAKGIDFYLPTHSGETRIVSKYEDAIRKLAPTTAFMVSPFETFLALDDKASLAANLKAAGIPTPRLYEEGEASPDSYPLFMKRKMGSGGAGAGMVLSPCAHSALASDYPDALFFEVIEGAEITVDCMFDENGTLLAFNQRRRVKTMGGAAVVTENDYSVDLKRWIEALASSWKFRGCVNFQCIIGESGPYFTDVNLRYPSGGLPLTVESGIDVPEMMLRMLSGEKLSYGQYRVDGRPRVMFRYFEESFR